MAAQRHRPMATSNEINAGISHHVEHTHDFGETN